MKRRKEHAEDVLPGEAGGWALGSLGAAANTVTVLRRTAWALLVAGPVLAGWALVSQPAVTAPAAPVRQEQPAAGQSAVGPGGFAELFVSAYLTAGAGTEELLAPFLPNARDVSLTADPGVQRAQEVAAVRVRPVSSGYWSVTVAARVAPAGPTDEKKKPGPDEVGAGPVLRYFQVPVRTGTGGALAAVALPAEVGAPLSGGAPVLAYGQSVPVRSNDPAGQTLTGFFAAYLAGSGELDRYLSPGTALAVVSPAPYTQVAVDRLAEVGTNDPGSTPPQSDGARRRLLVDITASDAGGQKRPLTYAITITARDGRWEIASVEGAPVLSNEPAGAGTKESKQ